jgi:hypothetical protein
MKLSAPTTLTWLVAVSLGVLGVLQHFGILHVSIIQLNSFWFVTAGFALLTAGTIFKKL